MSKKRNPTFYYSEDFQRKFDELRHEINCLQGKDSYRENDKLSREREEEFEHELQHELSRLRYELDRLRYELSYEREKELEHRLRHEINRQRHQIDCCHGDKKYWHYCEPRRVHMTSYPPFPSFPPFPPPVLEEISDGIREISDGNLPSDGSIGSNDLATTPSSSPPVIPSDSPLVSSRVPSSQGVDYPEPPPNLPSADQEPAPDQDYPKKQIILEDVHHAIQDDRFLRAATSPLLHNNMRIGIFCVCTSNLMPYLQDILNLNQNYALCHGYDWNLSTDRKSYRHPSWEKVLLAKQGLKQGYDYVWIIDADLIIMNHSKKLEDLIQQYFEYDILISSDAPNSGVFDRPSGNSGSILYKNSAWTKLFLDELWDYGFNGWEYKFPWEQGALNEILLNHLDHIKVLDLKELNSHFSHDNYKPGDFILHLMAMDIKEKEKLAKVYVPLARTQQEEPQSLAVSTARLTTSELIMEPDEPSRKSPKIVFYTWCNSLSSFKLQLFLNFAKRQDIDIKVLGDGIEWLGLSSKLTLTLKELKTVKDDTIVVFTDAFDVLYVQNASTIYEKFVQGGYSILFAAEKWYSHQDEEYKSFYDGIETPYDYKYLNSGSFMGYKKHVYEMIDNIISWSNFEESRNDQWFYGKYCFENPKKVALDYNCDIFWCTAGEWENLPELYEIQNGFILNKSTGAHPAIIHIPWSSKYYSVLLKLAKDLEA